MLGLAAGHPRQRPGSTAWTTQPLLAAEDREIRIVSMTEVNAAFDPPVPRFGFSSRFRGGAVVEELARQDRLPQLTGLNVARVVRHLTDLAVWPFVLGVATERAHCHLEIDQWTGRAGGTD